MRAARALHIVEQDAESAVGTGGVFLAITLACAVLTAVSGVLSPLGKWKFRAV